MPLSVAAQTPAENPAIAVVALDRKEPVAYDRDIAPILLNKCVSCHSGNVTKGNLDLASYAALIKGGKKGPPVIAGKATESLLIQLAGKTAKPFMPPKSDEPLTPQELALLKLWIDQGARPPSGSVDQTSVVKAPAPGVRLVRAVVVSPDGGTVIAARANQIHVYDAKSGSHTRSLVEAPRNHAHLGIVESLALSPDGKVVASGSYQEVSLWDTRTGQLQRKLTGFADRVVSLSFSPDGRLLATGGGTPTVNGEVKVFEVGSGKLVAELAKAHSDTVFSVSFSPDGNKLATASGDFAVKVFAIPEGKLLKTLEGHSHHVLDVAWKPDGKLLATAGTDRVVKLWDYERGEQLTKLGRNMSPNNEPMNLEHAKPVSRVAFIGDTW
ncbi:MAG: NB-ARC domain protein, partial [Planctomycetia bacterium]|nr:NB-ARC domain protein [Planctomycetia bacterium]